MEYILIEPEFPINLGAICRALMNFGVTKLHIVNPKVDLQNKEVKMFAKKAYVLIENADIYENMEHAIIKIKPKVIVGTSGVKGWFRRGIMRKMIPLKEVKDKLRGKGKKLIVFGREGLGLNEHESSLCNFFINIPTSQHYKVMNLSHALTVIAYELENIEPIKDKEIGDINNLCRTFNGFVDTLGFMTQIRKEQKIKGSFKNVISRGLPTPNETNSLLAVLHRAEKVLGQKLKKANTK